LYVGLYRHPGGGRGRCVMVHASAPNAAPPASAGVTIGRRAPFPCAFQRSQPGQFNRNADRGRTRTGGIQGRLRPALWHDRFFASRPAPLFFPTARCSRRCSPLFPA